MTATTPEELRARAAELENRVPPVHAGPRTDDERMFLEKATTLRAEADRLETPGTRGTLKQRVTEVLQNEIGIVDGRLAIQRVQEVIDAWHDDVQVRDRARDAAVVKLNPFYSGQVPEYVAREMADAALDAARGERTTEE